MASAAVYIDDFNYAELSQNYDPIYNTLIEGGVVWMYLNFNDSELVIGTAPVGDDGYIHFMVTQWWINHNGLNIPCPDGSLLIFPNGSHHTPSSPK